MTRLNAEATMPIAFTTSKITSQHQSNKTVKIRNRLTVAREVALTQKINASKDASMIKRHRAVLLIAS